jgi:hypothetical protein
MIEFDRTKSLQELENKDWSEPNFDSHIVTECHRLHRIPLKDFAIEDLRIMISQDSSLNYLVPLAIEKLDENPLAEGAFYPGDLLVSVLRAQSRFWLKHPDLVAQINQVAERAFAQAASLNEDEREELKDAHKLFLRASASLR